MGGVAGNDNHLVFGYDGVADAGVLVFRFTDYIC